MLTEERPSRRWWRMRATARDSHAAATPRGTTISIAVADLSQTGARCSAPTPPAPGDQVTLHLACVGEKAAIVEWVREDRFGCRFLVPLRYQDVDRAFLTPTVMTIGGKAAARLPERDHHP